MHNRFSSLSPFRRADALDDEAQTELLDKLANRKFAGITPELKEELLHFFSEPGAPYATKRDARAWAKVQSELVRLKNAATSVSSAGASDMPPF